MAELLQDFLERTFPVAPFHIGRGVFPVGSKMVLFAPSKSNKSFVAMNLALDIATGRNAFGAEYSNGTPVLPIKRSAKGIYFEQEIGGPSLQGRLKGIIEARGASLVPLYISTRDTAKRLDTDEGRRLIEEEIIALQPQFIVLDPISKYHTMDENSQKDVAILMRVLDTWIERFKLSIIFVHHMGHEVWQSPRKGGDAIRGSTQFYADVDTIIRVTRTSAENHPEPLLKLDFELRHGAPIETQTVRRLQSGDIKYIGEGMQASVAINKGA